MEIETKKVYKMSEKEFLDKLNISNPLEDIRIDFKASDDEKNVIKVISIITKISVGKTNG